MIIWSTLFNCVFLVIVNSMVFNAKHSDFTARWYYDVGISLTLSMLIEAFMPLVEFLIDWLIIKFERGADGAWKGDPFHTKSNSQQEYIEKYSGPDFEISARYSTILLFLCISLIYGSVMPLLYPISLLAMFVLFTLDRCLVCYFYREPPSVDERLTQKAISYARRVPLLSLPFLFW